MILPLENLSKRIHHVSISHHRLSTLSQPYLVGRNNQASVFRQRRKEKKIKELLGDGVGEEEKGGLTWNSRWRLQGMGRLGRGRRRCRSFCCLHSLGSCGAEDE